MAVSQISKDRKQRTQRRIYLVLGSIFYIYFVACLLQYFAIRRTDKRIGFSDAFNQAMSQVFTKPLAIFPLQGSTLLFIFLFSIFAGAFLVMFVMDKGLRKHDNPETVKGEAHLMNEKELEEYNKKRTDPIGKKTNDGPNNMIFSRDLYLAIDGRRTRKNANVLVIGGSGAGKSRFFAAPNILQYNTNFVITDPSGELLRDYGKALEDNGYEVKVFNLTDVYRGNRYNPFHYIKEEKDVFILVETLIKNTTPSEGHGGDPFWEKSEKLLISALVLYLWHVFPEEKQTFANVVKLVNMAEVDENDPSAESPLDILFKDLEREDPENLAVSQYKTFKLGAGKTLKSILISVGVRLETFTLSDITYLTNVDDFEFERFADTKQALFIVIPTADTTFNFIVSLMYSQLFMSMYNYVEKRVRYGWEAYLDDLNVIRVEQANNNEESETAKKEIEKFVAEVKAGTKIKYDKEKKLYRIYTKKGRLISWRGTKEQAEKYAKRIEEEIKIKQCPEKCPNHVRLILDEFANIGQIPDFNQKLATIRKYEISCSIILQALSQLKELYEKQWNTLAGNCDTKLLLGSSDIETLEWFVKFLGKKTTVVESTSWQANGQGSTSYNRDSIELLTVDQLTLMKEDECLVLVVRERPFYGKKYELTMHPNYKYAQKTAGTFEIPLSEAAKNRRIGPLRLRIQQDTEDIKESAAMAESSVQETETPEVDMPDAPPSYAPDDSEIYNEQTEQKNNAAQDDAQIAKDAIKHFGENFKDEASDMIEIGLMESLGIAPDSTDTDIKEAIESMIVLDNPPMDMFTYAMTN